MLKQKVSVRRLIHFNFKRLNFTFQLKILVAPFLPVIIFCINLDNFEILIFKSSQNFVLCSELVILMLTF